MKGWKKRLLALFLISVLALSCGGCAVSSGISAQFHKIFGLGSNQLFRIEGEICQKGEAEIFLASQKAMYESSYGSDIWNVEMENGKTFGDHMLDSLKELLARLKCMQIMAREQGVSLTSEESSLAETAGKEYYSKLGRDTARQMDVSESLAIQVFKEYRLANKLAERLTEDENSAISDSDARVIHIQEIKTADLEKATEALERANQGSDFESLAQTYSDGTKGTFSTGRGELPAPVEEGAFSLGDGQISQIIDGQDGYYYIIKCIEDYDAAATQTNKDKIAEQNKVETFLTEYRAFYETCSSELNEKAWESLSFENVSGSSVNFYEIYNQYFSPSTAAGL